MPEKKRPLREFHASLREVEEGRYLAEHSGEINPDNPNAHEIPDRHVGTSAQEVKLWVEQIAVGLGYERVIWDALPEAVGVR